MTSQVPLYGAEVSVRAVVKAPVDAAGRYWKSTLATPEPLASPAVAASETAGPPTVAPRHRGGQRAGGSGVVDA